MLISIVIPNLNKGPFLAAALESVFRQDYDEIEFIGIDGGSCDNSLEIFSRYRHRFSALISEPDDGQANAINKGFRLAKGDVVAWLNSDDLYFPGAVRRAAAAFQADPQLDLLYGDGILIDERDRFLRCFVEVEPYSEYRLRNCSDYIMQPTTFFRRKALEEVGYLDESMHFAFDWDLWCKLSRLRGAVTYLSEFMAATRIYPETKTSSGGWRRLREIQRVIARHRTRLFGPAYWGYLATELHSRLPNESRLGHLCTYHLTLCACRILTRENVRHYHALARQQRPVDLGIPAILPDAVMASTFPIAQTQLSRRSA